MITAGMDCGAKTTQAVILKGAEILGKRSVLTGFNPVEAVEIALAGAVEAAGISRGDIESVAATGSGKDAVSFASRPVSDIKAMARAARFFYPASHTVADVGAEEGRAARIAANGEPIDFAVNDRCAAGAGAFIEAMARALEVRLEQMGPLSLKSENKLPMNAQCVIFAESEVVGLIHAKTNKADISRAIHDAIGGRTAALIRRIGIREDVVLLGGVGRNLGFVASMQRELQVDHLCVPTAPEFGAAVGAAVAAAENG